MKVVIMAGGKGTRVSSVASDIPKPMIKIEGKPELEHEVECLRDQGFTEHYYYSKSSRRCYYRLFWGWLCVFLPQIKRPFGVHIEYYLKMNRLQMLEHFSKGGTS